MKKLQHSTLDKTNQASILLHHWWSDTAASSITGYTALQESVPTELLHHPGCACGCAAVTAWLPRQWKPACADVSHNLTRR